MISDNILEIDEEFSVTLEVSDPNVLLENRTATIIIENDDRKIYSVITMWFKMKCSLAIQLACTSVNKDIHILVF